ncbi:MAG: HAD family hydrolase [Verrucomicrobiales bacterium]|nr:HAD family hydrolase [Verrucomicrobiales bacterium]
MIRLVLFDIDGTLIASGGAGVRAFAEVARVTFGIPGGTQRLTFAGRTDFSLIREFFRLHGIPTTPENFGRFLDDYAHWLATYLVERAGRVLPGVREALRALRAMEEPPVLGLLTGNVRLGAELKLRHYGLWEEFSLGAFADDAEDRNRIAAIARDRGSEWVGRPLGGEEVLVVGDTHHDIACARAIGAPCLAVATGGTPLTELRGRDPAWAVESLAEVCWRTLCARQ